MPFPGRLIRNAPGYMPCGVCPKHEYPAWGSKLIASTMLEQSFFDAMSGLEDKPAQLEEIFDLRRGSEHVCVGFTLHRQIFTSAAASLLAKFSSVKTLHISSSSNKTNLQYADIFMNAFEAMHHLEDLRWMWGCQSESRREFFARSSRGTLRESLCRVYFMCRENDEAGMTTHHHTYERAPRSRIWNLENEQSHKRLVRTLQVPLFSDARY